MPNKKNDASEKFKEVPEKKYKPEKEEKKSRKNNLIKVREHLVNNYDFRYNVFIQKPEYSIKDKKEFIVFDERAYNNLLMNVKMDLGINITDGDFRSLIGSEKVSDEYDPIKDYIFSLPKWDGKDRFPEFLRCVQLKDEEINRPRLIKYFKRWFISYVGALVEDHRYNENCLVLVGGQGIGKTRFLISLVPKHLRRQYTFVGDFNFDDKDHKEMLGNKLIINLDEMSSLTRTDVSKLKTTMSLQQIEVRRAYGKQAVLFSRRASFCGSINEDQFLTDQTGNRRWLCFNIEGVQVDENYDISLLYSQALAEIKKGFITYFELQEIRELESYLDQFRRRPIEEELILENLRVPNELDYKQERVKWMQTTAIDAYLKSDEAFKKVNVNETTVKKCGMALKSLGFPRKSIPMEGRNSGIYCWGVIKLNSYDAEQERKNRGNNDQTGLPI